MDRNTKIALGGAAVAAGAVAWLAARERNSDAPASYPPLEVLKPFAEGVWIVDSGPMIASGLSLPIRMTVMRLPDRSLMLHSPTRFTPALAASLAELGVVRHLIAPNIAHWTRLPAWQRAYPQATLWAAPGLAERAQVQRAGLRIDRELDTTAPVEWADTVDQGLIAGAAGFTEVWFHHRPSRTLVLTDVVQHMEPERLPPITALIARLSGGATGTTPRYLRPVLRFGGRDLRAAVATLIALSPTRVVFAHGRPFTEDATTQLRRALAWAQ
ncbi:DUF4336 domain-containing protein [uncultured Sphingomonas sp.]|uniref:DUF4336 domain-containing protein n=1 Tax=uncultured Sphingomonas sp. TaxID=158754 RepID=UPI003748E204